MNRDCPWNYANNVVYPNATPQESVVLANFTGQNNHTQSEDCLYLNIWSKATFKVKKPVLVYFHGGRMSSLPSPFFLILKFVNEVGNWKMEVDETQDSQQAQSAPPMHTAPSSPKQKISSS